MASFRRGFMSASRLAKQVIVTSRTSSTKASLQQARIAVCLPSSLVHRNISDMNVLKQTNQRCFNSFPMMTTSTILSTMPVGASGSVDATSGCGSSELEGAGSDDEGLVTPAEDPVEDL